MGFRLAPQAEAGGYRLAAFDTIGSTNSEAMARARAGEAGGLWVVSRAQTAGRGRRGRAWSTAEGNLAASLLCRVERPAAVAATLGFVAGLALEAALRRLGIGAAVGLDGAAGAGAPGRADRLALKWPNDVLAGNRKLAGILLESETHPAGGRAVVVGIGVNVASAPVDLPYPATSLAEFGAGVGPEAVFEALSASWVEFERLWDDGDGFANIRSLWLARAAGLGAEVAVRMEGRTMTGIFETIGGDGQLVVRCGDGARHSVTAGEVHFGAVAGAAG